MNALQWKILCLFMKACLWHMSLANPVLGPSTRGLEIEIDKQLRTL
jgi:hypothetical protein